VSIYNNGDGSISDGIKVEAPGRFIAHQFGLALSSAAQLTMPNQGETTVYIQTVGGDATMTLDGSTPTGTTGWHLVENETKVLSATDAANAKFVQISSATSYLNATFTE
jgi:hypothetical protein